MLTLFHKVGKSGIMYLLCLASCRSPVVLGPWLLQMMRRNRGCAGLKLHMLILALS